MSILQEAALLEQRPAILEAQGRVRRAMGCRLEDAQWSDHVGCFLRDIHTSQNTDECVPRTCSRRNG